MLLVSSQQKYGVSAHGSVLGWQISSVQVSSPSQNIPSSQWLLAIQHPNDILVEASLGLIFFSSIVTEAA
jgi:hypothetical protein